MAKKILMTVLLVSMLLSCLTCSAWASGLNSSRISDRVHEIIARAELSSGLPSIDEALFTMDADSGKIEVSDRLEEYDPDNFGESDFGQFRIVILERWLPEKEFTEYDSGYPDSFVEDFPDDFTGIDIGESRVWLRCDLMNQLPRELRAASMEEADVVIIAESQYFLSGSISVSDFYYSDDEELPEFETIEEMEAYIAEHQPVIKSITYYPKFGAYALVDFYSPVTKTCQIYDYTTTFPKRFARNPAAQEIWYDMEAVAVLLSELTGATPDRDLLLYILGDLEEQEIAAGKTVFWKTCIEAGEYQAALGSVNEYYWGMAADLSEADPDEDHRANYSMVIEAQDLQALAVLANFCDYGGFDTPVEEIRDNKEYLAVPDYDWLEGALEELMGELI